MNLYTVVTGKIMEGDLTDQWDFDEERSVLAPVPKELIGLNTDDVTCVILRPVKVPSEEEMLQAVVNHCQKEIDCENCHSERECYQCYYKTMLRLMGLKPEQA
jgi:hypothetical protein